MISEKRTFEPSAQLRNSPSCTREGVSQSPAELRGLGGESPLLCVGASARVGWSACPSTGELNTIDQVAVSDQCRRLLCEADFLCSSHQAGT